MSIFYTVCGLAWFVIASISFLRDNTEGGSYGFAISCLFLGVGRLFKEKPKS